MPTLFLLFNHQLTMEQEASARQCLGVDRILPPSPEVLAIWSQLPADASGLAPILEPVRNWLTANTSTGDFVLIQGDFGATFLMVIFARKLGLIPIYSTTERQAIEEHKEDGSVHLTHRFLHILFRRYGE